MRAATLVGVVGNAYKQSMIFPAPTSPTATNKNQSEAPAATPFVGPPGSLAHMRPNATQNIACCAHHTCGLRLFKHGLLASGLEAVLPREQRLS